MWEDPWAQLRKDAAQKQKEQSQQEESQKTGGSLVVDKSESLADILNRAMHVSGSPWSTEYSREQVDSHL